MGVYTRTYRGLYWDVLVFILGGYTGTYVVFILGVYTGITGVYSGRYWDLRDLLGLYWVHTGIQNKESRSLVCSDVWW